MPAPQDRTGSRPRGRIGAGRPRRTAATMMLLVVLALTACSAPAQLARDQSPATGPTRAAPDDPSTRGNDVPAEPATDCGDEVGALDAVITEQLAAFASGDWDRAFSLTSRQFRAAGIDADDLRRIVTSGYAEAADAASHEVLGCVRSGDDAQLLIEITATDGATLELVYLMTREGDRWRISGAVEHGTGPTEPGTVTA